MRKRSSNIEEASSGAKGLISPTLSSRGEGEVLHVCIRLAEKLKKARLRHPLLLRRRGLGRGGQVFHSRFKN
jgi:hypothetical protein